MGLATNVETDAGVWGETLYIDQAEAEFKARAVFGALTPETLNTSFCTARSFTGRKDKAKFSPPLPAMVGPYPQ